MCCIHGKEVQFFASESRDPWQSFDLFFAVHRQEGVCSPDLLLYTSTNGLKQVYTIPEAIY
jgi:hypothetical protein